MLYKKIDGCRSFSDKVNKSLGLTSNKYSNTTTTSSNKKGNISSVDINGDGQVTIKEAKYPYMDDRDTDGMVGE